MEDGYSICFNEWALDKNIKNELGLLLIISSLCAERGYCFASNEYFANLFNETEETISRKIKNLSDSGYLTIDYDKKGTQITNRYLRLSKISTDRYQKNQWSIDKNINGINNNISINNIKEENILKEEKRFKKPTLEEVEEYIKENNYSVDAKTFYNYFEVGNWKDSKGNQVKNWKQKLITWEKKGGHTVYNNRQQKPIPEWFDKEITESEQTETQEEDIKQEEWLDFINDFRNQ